MKRIPLVACVLLVSVAVQAGSPRFGPFDVPTVFFIAKSDDHNRVDYGLRLDEHCAPVGDEPLFPYWREFEHPPVRTHGLAFYEYLAYGVSDQIVLVRTPTRSVLKVRLKALPRDILITTRLGADHHCTAEARATVGKTAGAVLTDVFVQLGGGLGSIDYVDLHGKDPRNGTQVRERLVR